MKILAIETSTMLGGVAVADSRTGLIAEVRLNVKTNHSEVLMTTIDTALKQAGLTLADLDCFAVASGPGSFTGLRIGLSTAKGLAYATNKPLLAVPTLRAFAFSLAYCRYPVCVMLDARRAEVYAAAYRWEEDRMTEMMHEVSLSPEALLSGFSEKIVFAGEGAVVYRDKIISAMGENALFAPADKMVPSPSALATLGLQMAAEGPAADLFKIVPRYIRRSEAEVQLDEKNRASGR